MNSPARILIPALICVAAPFAEAASRDGHLEVTLTPGYDTNPLELRDAADAREGAAYTELGLDTGFNIQWTPLFGTFADLDGAIRAYESDLSDADRDWVELRAGATLTPYRNGARGFAVAFGGTFDAYRATYVDPATGDVYHAFDGSRWVPVPDRFDFDAAGAFLDVRWRTHERVLVYLDSKAVDRRYAEDDSGTLSSLDDRTVSLEPGVLLDLGERWRLDVSYRWSDRRYDDLPSLDRTAAEVPGERREYLSTGYSITFGFEPTDAIRLALGVTGQARDDRYAGYYDNSGVAVYAAADYSLGEKTRFRGWIARRDVEYDHATVGSLTSGETLDTDRLLAAARAERDLNRHLTILGEAGLDRTDSRDPLFTYDRNWVRAGIRFRL